MRIAALLFLCFVFSGITYKKSSMINLVIHAGAGNITAVQYPPDKRKIYEEKLRQAYGIGYTILEKGGSSLDAVEAVVKVLEDAPFFNAGKGSVLNAEGKIEMDASIMDGSNLKAGAVAAVSKIKNPVSAARAVMKKSPHVFLTGTGAEQFARFEGLKFEDESYFYTPETLEQKKRMQLQQDGEGKAGDESGKYGTVGAVALDKNGHLAAATSTGGMTAKKYGRIGDSPVIGAGTYASDNSCAVSCTGHGEFFIRTVAAFKIAALVEYKNYTVEKASIEVLDKIKSMGGSGGVIVLDKRGNFAINFNTKGMFRAYRKEDKVVVELF